MSIIENKELSQAKRNQQLLITQGKLERAIARLEYVAMMADVDLDDDEEAESFYQAEEETVDEE